MQTGDLIHQTYRILKPIGRGGIGEIFLAYHEHLRKYVVVKKIFSHVSGSVNCRLEADILKGLHHRYLPQVYDFLELEEGIFTVMDYIFGYDLSVYLEKHWLYSEEQLVKWLRQLCEVLEYLHTRNPKILHCDIKPANIMITESGDICLIDFNISLDGKNNKDLVGYSSRYASPEQIKKATYRTKGQDDSKIVLDERSDLYSLGCVFYHLMSGYDPSCRRKQNWKLADMHLGLDSALINIIDKCMNEEPRRRFSSAAQIIDALDHREKWTSAWRSLTIKGRIADTVMIVFTAVCLCCMIIGWRNMKQEAFFEAYETFMETSEILYEPLAEDGDYEGVISSGLELLRSESYEKQFDIYAEEKANVYYSIALAYMELENYTEAETYLQYAAAGTDTNADIYRDLAIVCAHNDKLATARIYLEKAAALGLDETESALVSAEIAYLSGDYTLTYEEALIASKSTDSRVEKRASALVIGAAQQLGDYASCLAFVDEMLEAAASTASYCLWLSRGADLCVSAVYAGLADSSSADGSSTSNTVDSGSTGSSSTDSTVDSGSTGSSSTDSTVDSGSAGSSTADGSTGSGTKDSAGNNGSSSVSSSEAQMFLKAGIQYYLLLRETGTEYGYVSFQDLYQLAVLYELNLQTAESEELLLELEETYPAKYQVPMKLAYLYYEIENTKDRSQRDYTIVQEYYEKAAALCEAAGTEITSDEEMVQLKALIEDLTQKGWLS